MARLHVIRIVRRKKVSKYYVIQKQKVMKRAIVTLSCIWLAACSQSLPVSGSVQQTNERFVGTATGDIFGQGSLLITMDSAVSCTSQFTSKVAFASTGISSQGIINCSDGRTGNFFYSGTVNNGNGFGTLSDGNKFTFTYGR